MKIAINAGHYPGRDQGVSGATGLVEVSVTSDIMTRIAVYLRLVGYEVLEVQEHVLQKITAATNGFAADAFVAIHCNFASNSDIKGTETFFYAKGEDSEQLATCIQGQIVNSLGTEDRGVTTGNFYVLRLTKCPAALVEMGFMSNPEDEMLLGDEIMRDQFAAAIARGITDYFSMP